jgi:CARDB/Calcineurin-like phosphoesterase
VRNRSSRRQLLAGAIVGVGACVTLIAGVALGGQTRKTAAKLRPDLVERSLSGSPTTLRKGDALAVRDTVRNRGRTRAGKFTVGFYLVRPPAERVRIASRKVSSLGSAKSSSATTTARLPADIAPASYRLQACADDSGRVKERHEHNNCLTAAEAIRVLPADHLPPTSRASAPALLRSDVIPIDYSANGTGSPLERVELWVKTPASGAFSKVATDTSPATSGHHFSYAAAGDGRYAFYTRAYDAAGNAEAPPASPDAVTTVDTTAPYSIASAPALTDSTSIQVDYTADGTGSPLDKVELYARAPGHTDFSKVATDSSPASSGGHFDYAATAGDGDYAFYTLAYDRAGNVESAPTGPDATTTLDTAVPSSAATATRLTGPTSIQVDYTAEDAGTGLDRVELYAEAPGATGFSKVATDTAPSTSGGHFDYTAAAGDGDYAFYTVAYDRAGNAEAAPSSPDKTTTLKQLLGAGDIAGDPSTGGTGADTAALIQERAGQVVTLGDNAYDNGTLTEFSSWYDPTWGAFKSRTKPSAGNREDNTTGAAGYFGYFGAAAGDSTKGYYSYDLGSWHIVALNSNSNCSTISCAAGSDQETWLRTDLAQHAHDCILAYWHHPLYSSSQTDSEGDIVQDSAVRPLFKALYDYHADIVLNGHQHNYERFAQQDSAGNADSNGIREFVVGTGGRSHKPFPSAARAANSELSDDADFGILDLTLGSGSYSWQFVPTGDGPALDSGSGTCHNS